ncbi:tyrosine protein phosphatase [Bacillus sp. FJAT-27231]|uniref:tyrosine-protein phosphatase n=1 Tax=Bacillus sp. FJAT-27231 TaxID=1679168 RepID=UPI0006715691|nr:CpsB/CapC family capsule biosynthesis tyrosine phosphatase [Bacillus sp. FJAT-27231]KMY52978.1 tyrosine protein phosphatase [Bacillus sp. FJAT-27231]
MIDLHCHILPGLDDGPATLEESLTMAEEAEKEGITTIVATPHHKNESFYNVKKAVTASTAVLNKELKSAGINVQILPGQEIRIYGEIIRDLGNEELLTLGGNPLYLLIEFPSNYVPRYTEQLFFDIQMKGIIPIIAHPERNKEFIQYPDKLYRLVKNGAATQITAASYAGRFGKKIQRFTDKLIEANLTHFVSSDAHNVSSRGFHMAKAYERLQKKAGTDFVHYFQENAERIVNGQHIHKEPPERISIKKSFWAYFK